MKTNSSNLEVGKNSKAPKLSETSTGAKEPQGAGSYQVRNSRSVKPGPLPGLPPSNKEWKASGKRGVPPVAYQSVIKDAPNNALEYELYNGFKSHVSPFEIEQRIRSLRKGKSPRISAITGRQSTIYEKAGGACGGRLNQPLAIKT